VYGCLCEAVEFQTRVFRGAYSASVARQRLRWSSLEFQVFYISVVLYIGDNFHTFFQDQNGGSPLNPHST
jgi:hypothetical protein